MNKPLTHVVCKHRTSEGIISQLCLTNKPSIGCSSVMRYASIACKQQIAVPYIAPVKMQLVMSAKLTSLLSFHSYNLLYNCSHKNECSALDTWPEMHYTLQ